MNFRRIISGLSITSVILSTVFIMSSCTPKITEEQMMQLKELRNKEKSLTEMISRKKQEKKNLEAEVNARKAELKKCQDDKAFVTEKLSQWPNCWPDYTPGSEVK
ncbi:MAG: hypothetical protein A2X61_06850 [Ignavibacteria bacterium GWB2_35_12]|nr:MAG: hypothetical protein A2X61_06850 [Ignavibacteria bacterium GWB2_35_12]OGU87406.1 MAG: hypothetical protein A2220_01350 [Ignavibacteria bacterium RIFOXYA2_FULL_35_10]OGV22031.1 MAG: hypothetical protein A2475_09350 [Ignavibacteria bacterium RIFOXYC2_FULL_35_21]